jgi:hypothetical protein
MPNLFLAVEEIFNPTGLKEFPVAAEADPQNPKASKPGKKGKPERSYAAPKRQGGVKTVKIPLDSERPMPLSKTERTTRQPTGSFPHLTHKA